MDNIKNNLLWAAGAIVVSVAIAAYLLGGSPVVKTVLGATAAGITNLTGLSIDNTNGGPGTLTISSQNGIGGATFVTVRNTFVASATSTPCSNQLPSSMGTSTIISTTMVPTTGTSSVYQFFISTSSTAFATTSAFFTGSEVANGVGPFVAGETASTTGYGVIVFPGNWVNVGWSNTTGISPWVAGSCTTVFESII